MRHTNRFLKTYFTLAISLLFAGQQAWAQQLIATIDLPQTPGNFAGVQEVAVDTVNNTIYAPVGYPDGTGFVAVIDGASDTLIASSSMVGHAPWGIAVNPVTHKVYVANQNGGGVSVIDIATYDVIQTINPFLAASGVVVDSNTNTVYATQENSSNLWIIDGATDTLTATIDIGVSRPGLGFLNPSTHRLYILNISASPLKVFDTATNTVVNSIPVALASHAALDLVNNRLYVAEISTQSLVVIDLATETVAASIALDPSPLASDPPIGVGYNPNTNRIYVSKALSQTVVVIDAASFTPIKTLPAGNFGMAVNQATNKIYVCERGETVDGDPPRPGKIHVIQDGIQGPETPELTALGPAKVWLGLKNSDDVGTKFDLLAEVFKNGVLVGSGQLNGVSGGSSGFNNAVSRTINLALSTPVDCSPGDSLSLKLSVRIAVGVAGHRSGTARLWLNDAAADSHFDATIGGVTQSYYLTSGFLLSRAPGPGPKNTIDVFVDRAANGNPFKPFGTWSLTF